MWRHCEMRSPLPCIAAQGSCRWSQGCFQSGDPIQRVYPGLACSPLCGLCWTRVLELVLAEDITYSRGMDICKRHHQTEFTKGEQGDILIIYSAMYSEAPWGFSLIITLLDIRKSDVSNKITLFTSLTQRQDGSMSSMRIIPLTWWKGGCDDVTSGV